MSLSSSALSAQAAPRIIIVCLHPTSARLRFLKHPSGHITLPDALPPLAELVEVYQAGEATALHPGTVIRQLCEALDIPGNSLSVEQSMSCRVNVPRATVPVFCLRTVDEFPFTVAQGYCWIDLPDCVSLSSIEQQIMQRIYQWLMA